MRTHALLPHRIFLVQAVADFFELAVEAVQLIPIANPDRKFDILVDHQQTLVPPRLIVQLGDQDVIIARCFIGDTTLGH